MSVHKKLQEARIQLQSKQLKKSGLNKFSNFEYFELGDFLPTVQSIFSELGLGSSITFGADMAALTIVDTDSAESSVVFTCPVVVPTMKGCNEIQALGAMMTYIRRYLYVNALEIVEHDAIDATAGSGVHKPTKNDAFKPDAEEVKFLSGIVDKINSLETDFEAMDAYLKSQNLDSDEKVFIWDKLDSKTRSGIKKVSAK